MIAPGDPAERPSTSPFSRDLLRRPAVLIGFCIVWMLLILVKMPNLGLVWVDVAALVTAGAVVGFNVARLRPGRDGGPSWR